MYSGTKTDAIGLIPFEFTLRWLRGCANPAPTATTTEL